MSSLDHPDLEARLREQREAVLKRVRETPGLRAKLRAAKQTRAASRPINTALYREVLSMEGLRPEHHPTCPANTRGGNGTGKCNCGVADLERETD